MAQPLSMNYYANHTMRITGKGEVSAPPDLAIIRLGVQTTGTNLSQIQSENARITNNIIQTLNQAGVTQIKTVQYSIEKLYDYENGRQIDRGYSVQNILEIETNNIDQAGYIIDLSVSAGANIVQSISFALSEQELYYQHALNLAVDNAIQKAKSISVNLPIRLNPTPVYIVEGSIASPPIPLMQRDVAATPILPGELTIEALVTADFQYSE